jgi:hypothetical protein
MKLRVECYAGTKADERPVHFQLEDSDSMVDEVLETWCGPDDAFFKVRTDDSNLYILRRNVSGDEWNLESFRQVKDWEAGAWLAGPSRHGLAICARGVCHPPPTTLRCGTN